MKDSAGNELAVGDIVAFVGKPMSHGASDKRGTKLRIRRFSEDGARCRADDAIDSEKDITEHSDWTWSSWLRPAEVVKTVR